jgi:predicted DNA-binding protein
VGYAENVGTATSSFRMSKELQRKLSEAEARTGKGKNAIIVEALEKHLHTI